MIVPRKRSKLACSTTKRRHGRSAVAAGKPLAQHSRRRGSDSLQPAPSSPIRVVTLRTPLGGPASAKMAPPDPFALQFCRDRVPLKRSRPQVKKQPPSRRCAQVRHVQVLGVDVRAITCQHACTTGGLSVLDGQMGCCGLVPRIGPQRA